VFGIHSRDAGSGSSSGFTTDLGHAWMTAADYSTGSTPTITTYGLWPDSNRHIEEANLANGSGSDVSINFSKDTPTGAHNRYYLLAPSKAALLQTKVGTNLTWAYTFNCASFSTDTCYAVTGEDVDADSWLGYEMPTEFGESIDALEESRATSRDDPKP